MRPVVAIVPAQCIVDITGKRVIGIQPEHGPYRGDFRKVNDEFSACTIYVIPVSRQLRLGKCLVGHLVTCRQRHYVVTERSICLLVRIRSFRLIEETDVRQKNYPRPST